VQEETLEVVSAFDNGQPLQSGPTPSFQGEGNFQKSSWPTLRDLVVNQAKNNEGINKRVLANDKTLGLLTSKMDSLASTVKDQQNFNKVLESRMTQIAASVNSCYSSNAVTTTGGKTTRDPPYPNMTRKPARKDKQYEEDKVEEVELPSIEESTKFNGKVAPHEDSKD